MARGNPEYLKPFLVVVRLGGVHKAAQMLNLTQPAVTVRIKSLETSLSAILFDRTSTGISAVVPALSGPSQHCQALQCNIPKAAFLSNE